jgi:hypothetical protein
MDYARAPAIRRRRAVDGRRDRCTLVIATQWANARPLWLDEEMIALNFRDRPLRDLGGRLCIDQSAPFGWLALQRAVVLVLGSSGWRCRRFHRCSGSARSCWRSTSRVAGCRRSAASCCSSCVRSVQWISFYAVEPRPYSADTFWALLLPALAVNAADASSKENRRRAILNWTAAAVLGHWFSLGRFSCCRPAVCSWRSDMVDERDAVRLFAVAISLLRSRSCCTSR